LWVTLANGENPFISIVRSQAAIVGNEPGRQRMTTQEQKRRDCSGSMNPDTNVGGNVATINEMSDDQKTMFLYS
jgi:hypothetical protein